jgi:crotonobetainyl-CoA:carnitine CoA-transferase CaiB-like acyl-CoA transferase
MASSLPLAGLKILTCEQYGAGPYASMFLAQLGAEVIKIEPPLDDKGQGGDFARATGPHFLGENDSLFFQTFNLNKRSLTLNLKAPEGREIFEQLVADADVVMNNMRGDQPASLGLDYAALKAINPRIVCGHLSAYGRDNARATWPGYDYLMQAEAGFLSLTGEPEGPPARFGLSMVDFMTGTMLALGIVSAVLKARSSGEGADVDVALLDTALHQLSYPATWYLNEGDVTTRAPRSAHPSITPSQLFRTANGWVFIMAQMPKFYHKLVEALGRPDLLTDPRFATIPARLAHRDALTQELDAVLMSQTTAHWVSKLAGAVPCAPVYDVAQALDNPFLDETAMITQVDHPERASLRVLANPIRLNGARLPASAGPGIGADTDAILAGLGYAPTQVAALKAKRAV